jgi:hypothetical protein
VAAGDADVAGARGEGQPVLLAQDDHERPRVDEGAPALDDELEHAVEVGLAADRAGDRRGRLEAEHGTLERGPALLGALVEPRVLDRDARPVGEDHDRLLVGAREVPAAGLLGQVQVAPGLAADHHRDAEERVHRRMSRGEAVRARVVAHPVQPQRPRVVDERAEDPAAARRVADRPVRRRIDPGGEEPLEPAAALVEDAERGVRRTGQLARRPEQLVEDGLEVEVRDERAAGAQEPAQLRVVQHAFGHVAH